MQRTSSVAIVCLALPSVLAACTSLKEHGSGYIDFDDQWTLHGYPCGAAQTELDVAITQQARQLRATAFSGSTCIAARAVVFRATLPRDGIQRSRLPVSVDAELTLGGPQTRTLDGTLTVTSPDVLRLEAGGKRWSITRGADGASDALDGSAADGGGASPAEKHSGSGSAADGGEHDAAGGGKGGSGAGGTAQAQTNAGTSGRSEMQSDAGSSEGGPMGSRAQDAGQAGQSAPKQGVADAAPSGSGRWLCLQFGAACSCIRDAPESGDSCALPKPTCCFTLYELGQDACQCWPRDSTTCRDYMAESDTARPVPACPPP